MRIRWAGRRPRLWRSVIDQLEDAEQFTHDNDRLTLQFCVNYGGRAEIADAAKALARDVAAGKVNANKIDETLLAGYLDEPGLPDVDLFIRTSGEQRTSNFMLWQSAYAEFVFVETLWPDFDRRHLWDACLTYAKRDRRFGAAGPVEAPEMISVDPARRRDATTIADDGRRGAAGAGRPSGLSCAGSAGRATDDPTAWVLVTEWRDVGSYRRALGNYDVKMHAQPLLARALDEVSAFEVLVEARAGRRARPACTATATSIRLVNARRP